MDCGTAGQMSFLLPPSEFMTAFVPFHAAMSTQILVPLEIVVDGTTYVSKPSAATAGDLATCSYVDPQGYRIEITGRLAPGR